MVYTYAQGLLRKLCNRSDIALDGKTSINDVLPKRLPHQACGPLRTRDQKGLEMRQMQEESESFRPDQLSEKKTDQEIIEGLPRVVGQLHETVSAYATSLQMDDETVSLCNARPCTHPFQFLVIHQR